MSLLHQWSVRHTRQLALFNALTRRQYHYSGTLTLHANGLWQADPAIQGYLRLARVWQTPAWLTLRFLPVQNGVAVSATPSGVGWPRNSAARPAAVAPRVPQGRVDLVIWKHSLAGTAWRSLRTQVARQAVMPRRALKKEGL
ncbi:hypothetical protein H0A71_07085 [Alcaligenaceae bacterium]|nr:hypothetical protein [Alcaligenaceae bacterium]